MHVTRRKTIETMVLGALAPVACSSGAVPDQRTPRGSKGNGLRPGRQWTGVAGSGGRPPEQSDKPAGTLVPDERFIGGFSAAPGQWLHGPGIRITALGLPPQSAGSDQINYFKEAVFYLEGNSVTVTEWSVNPTPVTMYDGTRVPQGSIGFSVEIGAGDGPVTAGDAILYCFLRGEHGLERRIEIPIVINVDNSLDRKRVVRFVDPVRGDDQAEGSQAAPWKTIGRGLCENGVGSGGKLVLMRAGRYIEDRNTFPGLRQALGGRSIEVVPAEGLRPDQVIITRTDRYQPEPRWIVNASCVQFHRLTIDLAKIPRVMGPRGAAIAFHGCQLLDRDRLYGDRDPRGRGVGLRILTGDVARRDLYPVLPFSGQGFYLLETLFDAPATFGARLYRNVRAKLSTDSLQGGPGYDNLVIDGYDAVIGEPAPSRLHTPPSLVVESVARQGANTTEIVVRDTADLPSLRRVWDLRVRVARGAGEGSPPAQLVSADPATRRIVIEADWAGTLSPGDEVMCYQIWHADFMQQGGVTKPEHRGMHNTTIFRYRAEGPTAQLFLTQAPVPLLPGTTLTTQGASFRLSDAANIVQPDDMLRVLEGPQAGEYRVVKSFDPGTGAGVLMDPFSRDQAGVRVGRSKSITDFVMALSILRKTGTNWEMGQFQDGHRNFLLAQNTFISQPGCLGFRNKLPGHGHRNHVQLFNLCTRIDADTPQFPTYGLRIAHTHFLEGTARGKFGRVLAGKLSFGDAERYKPFADQLRTGRKPLVPFDSFGNPVDENSPVGAVSM